MRPDADPALFAIWARGWALTRAAPPPEAISGGWRIEANRSDHRWRFLYPAACDDIAAQARVHLPDAFAIKVAASAERVRPLLPPGWAIDATTCMMTAAPLSPAASALPANYDLIREEVRPGVHRVTISTSSGELAASGQVGLVDDVAIYDQIVTQDAHQRRGLGRAMMIALGEIANDAGAKRWMLAATTAGRALYETLGWQVHSPYTTAFIPVRADPVP